MDYWYWYFWVHQADITATYRLRFLGDSMDMHDALRRLRMEIGDPPRAFKTSSIGDGLTYDYDLPKQNIDLDTLVVSVQNGATVTTLANGPDYQIDPHQGFLMLTSPVPSGALLITSGTAWGLFTDKELAKYVRDSLRQHTHGRT